MIKEFLSEDVRNMHGQLVKDFVASAKQEGAEAILVIGGFPCKDLTSAKGRARNNLEGHESKLFWEVPMVISALRKASGASSTSTS